MKSALHTFARSSSYCLYTFQQQSDTCSSLIPQNSSSCLRYGPHAHLENVSFRFGKYRVYDWKRRDSYQRNTRQPTGHTQSNSHTAWPVWCPVTFVASHTVWQKQFLPHSRSPWLWRLSLVLCITECSHFVPPFCHLPSSNQAGNLIYGGYILLFGCVSHMFVDYISNWHTSTQYCPIYPKLINSLPNTDIT